MRMLTAQAIADEGELEVLGYELPADSKQARAECGVVPQLDNLDVTLTVEQNLVVFSHLYRIAKRDRGPAVEPVDNSSPFHPGRISKACELIRPNSRRPVPKTE
jgi:lipooligosaccharide transport system ATP-binding protein